LAPQPARVIIGGAGIGELVPVGIGFGRTCFVGVFGQLGYAAAIEGSWLGTVGLGDALGLADADAVGVAVAVGDAEPLGEAEPESVGEAPAAGEVSLGDGVAGEVSVGDALTVSVGEAESLGEGVSAGLSYAMSEVVPEFGLTSATFRPDGRETEPFAVRTLTSTPSERPTHIGLVPPRIARPLRDGTGPLSSRARLRQSLHCPVATDLVRT
jgi:hypothetical protein